MEFLLVAFGAAFGAPSRYLLDRLMQRVFAENHPRRLAVGTFTVNALGSALLGFVVAVGDSNLGLLLGVGFCGAFTTFSTFVAQTDMSLREGWLWVAALNVVASITVCFLAFWAVWSLFS